MNVRVARLDPSPSPPPFAPAPGSWH